MNGLGVARSQLLEHCFFAFDGFCYLYDAASDRETLLPPLDLKICLQHSCMVLSTSLGTPFFSLLVTVFTVSLALIKIINSGRVGFLINDLLVNRRSLCCLLGWICPCNSRYSGQEVPEGVCLVGLSRKWPVFLRAFPANKSPQCFTLNACNAVFQSGILIITRCAISHHFLRP